MSNTVYQIVRRREGVKAKQLRKEGFVPGIIYGSAFKEAVPVEFAMSDLLKLLKENTKGSILTLAGLKNSVSAVIKEVQKDNVSHLPTHIDFQAITKREIINVEVPVIILGEESLMMDKLMYQPNLTHIELRGPAEDIPEKIEIDVSELKEDDKVLVKDIKLPSGVVLHEVNDELVGIVMSPGVMETEAELEAAEVEVISEETEEPTTEK